MHVAVNLKKNKTMPIKTTVTAADLDNDKKKEWAIAQIEMFAKKNPGAPEVANIPESLSKATDKQIAESLSVVLTFRQRRMISSQLRALSPEGPRLVMRSYRSLDKAGKDAVRALVESELSRVKAESQEEAESGGKKRKKSK